MNYDELKRVTSKELFGKAFTIQLGRWIYKENLRCNTTDKTQMDFALELSKRTGSKVNKNSITDWKKGTIPKEDTLLEICDMFRVGLDYFSPLSENEESFEERLKRARDITVQDILENKLLLKHSEEIGLNLDLIEPMKMFICFEKSFPLYQELHYRVFFGSPLANLFPTVNEYCESKGVNFSEVELNLDEQLILLKYEDLDFLKILQEEITNTLEYMFYKRKKEINKDLWNKKKRIEKEILGSKEFQKILEENNGND